MVFLYLICVTFSIIYVGTLRTFGSDIHKVERHSAVASKCTTSKSTFAGTKL